MPSVGWTSDSAFAVGQSALRSSGTSPNFRISFASPKSPVAGSPLRLNATAPACPGLRASASACMTAALASDLAQIAPYKAFKSEQKESRQESTL